jgi:hypothetical protein
MVVFGVSICEVVQRKSLKADHDWMSKKDETW